MITALMRLRRVLLLLCVLGAVAAAPARAAEHWVGSWSASPSDAADPGFTDQTLRMVLTPHLGGGTLRVHLSNRFGDERLTVARVTIAIRRAAASLRAGTVRAVRFRGRTSVTIPPRADVVSDRVRLRFAAGQTLAVTMFLAGTSGPTTEHFGARQTSYLTASRSGDHTADVSGAAFTTRTVRRYLVTGIDVRAPRRVGAVVTFGDSITDGFEGLRSPVVENPSGLDRNGRYPDDLARRLQRAHTPLSVLNAGISGNRILGGGNDIFGPSGLSRLDADVVRQAGVRDVIVLEGINDIGQANATADQVIAGLRRIVVRLHRARLRVLLGTLTPAEGCVVSTYGSAAANVTRTKVNHWIRTQRLADGVVDFDKAVRDPRHPGRLAPRYDSSDHLHPSLAGYRAMARAVPLRLLR